MQFFSQEKLCSLDAKGRVRLPSTIISQLPEEDSKFFVIKQNRKKGILQVFSLKAWEKRTQRLMQVDIMLEENEEYVRRQLMGTSRVERDGSGRIQIPKHVLASLGFSDNIMVTAWRDVIELWVPDRYYAYMEDDSYDYGAESRRIYGNDGSKGATGTPNSNPESN